MDDPALSLTVPQIIEISAELEHELLAKKGPRPLLFLLQKMREDASVAMADLAFVDPRQPDRIIALQDRVRRFTESVGYLRELWEAGLEASAEFSEHNRNELSQLIGTEPEGSAEASEHLTPQEDQ